jgi:hypothetical protein
VAVETEDQITDFAQWYDNSYRVADDGSLEWSGGFSKKQQKLQKRYDYFKVEHDTRVKDYYKYEKQASAEVVSEKPDLANVSSGDSAGFIERIAKNVIQHTPNVELLSTFDDDSISGILARYFLTHKIIGDDQYSNDMHQNLLSSVELSLTLGFDCVIPILLQDAKGSWYMQYDTINYRDVFPEPGAKDVRRAHEVFVRRYLTEGDIKHLIRSQAPGWDPAALRRLLKTPAASREYTDHESRKHHVNPQAYEVITWYSDSGDRFLTWDNQNKMLLRMEKNKHPLKQHPVFFMVLKRDPFQPLGKSILAKTFGRQEFQDLFLNGAMKKWVLDLNPPLFGYGTVNAIPNLSPGKYTPIPNPNAKIVPFEGNSQTLMMFSQIASLNAANMGQLAGAADQQMAAQSTGGMMSQTPQGVEAQQAMVDTTTNDFQKAVENFLSEYLSYALTVFLQELKGVKTFTPDAPARKALEGAGMPPEAFAEDGSLTIPLSELAVQHYVRIVPGTLVEMEDEKQIRLLNQMFIPLSQAMPALAASQDQNALQRASAAMQFIITKQIELSGSDHSKQLKQLMESGSTAGFQEHQQRIEQLENFIGGAWDDPVMQAETVNSVLLNMKEQISLLSQGLTHVARAAGLPVPEGAPGAATGAPLPAPGGQPDIPGAPGPENSGAAQPGPPSQV